ncbi:MAG: GNAT family N-acetyltransferase [bacterium]|nr:GNAT family N-acetyltransferase [bacterium]
MAQLIALQFDTLLVCNSRGRLTNTRAIDARPVPRLFLGRSIETDSPGTHIWAVREDVDSTLYDRLKDLCEAEPRAAELDPALPPTCREHAWELLSPITFEHRGPAYALPDALPEFPRAREAPPERIREYLAAFPTWKPDDEIDPQEPMAFAFVGGEPAALCHSARAATRAAEAGVETRPEYRGRGLAVEVTACWARAIQNTGRTALYSTSWDNRASQAVARRLGARLYGEDWYLT